MHEVTDPDEQSTSLASVPVQPNELSAIVPVPSPKLAPEVATLAAW